MQPIGSATLWEANPAHAEELRFTTARPIISTHLSRDGTRAFLNTDQGLETWNLEAGTNLTTFPGRVDPLILHNDFPNKLIRPSPDGERLALVAEDNRVREYSTHGPVPLISPLPHAARISALEYDAPGSRFATGTATGGLEVFDAASGRSLTGVLHHGPAGQPGEIVSLHFTPDGRRLLSASADGLICLWDLGPTTAEPIPGWLPDLAEAIAGLRVGGGGSAEAPIGLEPVAHEKRRAIRLQLSDVAGQTAWAQLPRWLFADPQIRARSPFYESRQL